jgi:hypothetical protein
VCLVWHVPSKNMQEAASLRRQYWQCLCGQAMAVVLPCHCVIVCAVLCHMHLGTSVPAAVDRSDVKRKTCRLGQDWFCFAVFHLATVCQPFLVLCSVADAACWLAIARCLLPTAEWGRGSVHYNCMSQLRMCGVGSNSLAFKGHGQW